jgi:DNA repair protein SbcC/Rad50
VTSVEHIVAKLQRRYPLLERVADAVFRCVDEYEGRPWAIRYFDLTDDLPSAAARLHEYQDGLLGASYFNSSSKPDLRWNHYLYFVTSAVHPDQAFAGAKAVIESDREYARKFVVTENDLDGLLGDNRWVEPSEGLPPDPLSIWANTLEKHDLGFIVDETLQVPAIVRDIAEGERRSVLRPPVTPQLDSAERAVPTHFLGSIAIRGFRKYPIRKTFEFGAVNLVLGVNGVGKTSLFEAIEYLFCGRTRRGGSVLPRTSVAGTLANSNFTLRTDETTSSTTLRSRHLVWYGKSELKRITLHESLSKFNFLDTDAAVRLSVEKSRERIMDDLFQLLLGAEASKARDRFERVSQQLVDHKKKLETDIANRDARRSDAVARIQLLRDAPRESDTLFSDLLVAVRDAGWRQIPTEKRHAESLSALVQSALVAVALLRTEDGETTELVELDATIEGLAETERTIERFAEEEAVRKRDDAQAKLQLQQLSARLEALDLLGPLVAAGVTELRRRQHELERQLGESTPSLAEAATAATSAPSDHVHRQKTLAQAVVEWTQAVRVAHERVHTVKNAVTAFELAQNVLSSLRQRLRSNAQEIIEHTGDTTHCPLCRAQYSEAELANRFDLVTRDLVTDESDRLRSELREAEALRQELVSKHAALLTLERYVPADPAGTSLDAAIRFVNSRRAEVAAMASELEAVRSALRVHEEAGWTTGRFIQLASTARVADSELSSDGIDAARARIREEQKRLVEAASKVDADIRSARARLAEIGGTYGLEEPSASELMGVVSERKRLSGDRRRAISALRDQLNLAAVRSIAELEAQLREVQGLAVRLRTAMAKEQQDSDAVQIESKLVDDAVAEIEGLRVKLRRVDSATAVLQDLLSQQSERVLAETVLRENAAQIASTFAKIHAPNEFDLVINGGLQIVRRGGGSVELDEMSSGQRAAYALSLFLAMNERLRTGPRVLLLDDPVAHVDDINTLSLLDHLRDIALTSHRQIFFATADSKIGALFGRKFRFLGDRFKQIELTRD